MRASTSAEMADRRRAAFDSLTQSRLQRSYRLASVLLRDPTEAEDAVHDAAVRAWNSWDQLRDETHFEAWFDRIVVGCCRDRMRKRRLDQLPDDSSLQAARSDATLAEREQLRKAIAALSPDHRIVVALRFIDDLSVADIAARTGAREGTVKSRLHYALQQLRAAYEAEERAGGSHE